MSDLEDIKKNLKSDKMLIGTKETVKNLKLGKVKKVYLAQNCNPVIRKDIVYYCSLGGTELVELAIPNDELGVVCKKPFRISVLGLLA